MRKFTVILIHILFLTSLGVGDIYAQKSLDQVVDSIRLLILNSPDDTLKIGRYKILGDKLLSLDKASEMLKNAEQGLALSEKLNYPKGIIQMTLFKAIALDIMGQTDKALIFYNKALNLADTYGEGELLAKCYLNLGVCYQYLGDYDLALENQLLAYDLSDELTKKDRAKLLNNIGVIYRFQKKYERAEDIYLKSYELKEELKDSLGMAATLMNLGVVYNNIEGRDEMAVQYMQRGQNLYQLLGRLDQVASCNTALGQIFFAQQNIQLAKKAFKNAWAYYEKNITSRYSPATLIGLGEIALMEGDYKAAENYVEQAFELSRKFGNKEEMHAELFALSSIKDTLGKKGEAYKILKEAYAINDTLNQNIRLNAMEEMQAKFDVKEKVKELEISELKLNEQTRQRNIFLFGAIGLALFAMTIFFFLRNKIRTNKKISEQGKAIQDQKITELQQKNKLLALSSMVEGQEAERLRIAKDLHDSLGGLLSTVKNHFSTIQNEIKALEKLNLTEKTGELIDEACIEVRRISHNMMPHALSLSGLQGAMEDLAEQLESEGYDTTLEIKGELVNFDETKKVMIYRLVQEIISNIRKHAEANTILIQLLVHQNEIKLIIEDDGKGFNYVKARTQGGLGLKSINSRVEFLDGQIDWDSQPGKGTTISINIPV